MTTVLTADVCHRQRSEESTWATTETNGALNGLTDERSRGHCSQASPQSRFPEVVWKTAVLDISSLIPCMPPSDSPDNSKLTFAAISHES